MILKKKIRTFLPATCFLTYLKLYFIMILMVITKPLQLLKSLNLLLLVVTEMSQTLGQGKNRKIDGIPKQIPS